MTEQTTNTVPMFPALSLMEKSAPPVRYGHEPFWRPPVVPASQNVYIPVWNWESVHEPIHGQTPLTLDVNGAFLGAMGSVEVAHGALKRWDWKDLPTPREVRPGYYKITVPYWAFSGTIVSPVGDSARPQTESTMWVAHPTLVLLLELLEEGSISGIDILDSYTCGKTTRFKSWVEKLKITRLQCLTAVDQAHGGNRPQDCDCTPCARYAAFKEGYSAALSMMLTGEKCKTRRPDWSHAVYAQHAASSWRKAWRYAAPGRVLLSMGAVDEITIIREELPEVLAMPKPPFQIDHTGRKLGAFKAKAKPTPRTDHRPAALLADDSEDIF